MTADLSTATSVCQALGDPSRLRIVVLLRAMELAVGELVQVLGQSQPRVSRHVRILVEAGLVERHKEGSWVFLRLGPADAVNALLDSLLSQWTADAPTLARDRERLSAIRRDRADAAQRYFEGRAENWDRIRSLHVAESDVEAAIAARIGTNSLGRLVDIGTGTGRMLELFGARAVSSIGIDRSSEMLRLARVKLDEAGIDNVTLRQADMYALPLDDKSADTVFLHQVLHYAQAPGDAVAEAARLLDVDGRLLIIDFAPHGREELRRSDAHHRLGFGDEAIGKLLRRAGMTLESADELTGGELTVKIWVGRKAPVRARKAA